MYILITFSAHSEALNVLKLLLQDGIINFVHLISDNDLLIIHLLNCLFLAQDNNKQKLKTRI